MKRISALVLSTALLVSAPAMAQLVEGWDTDANGILSEEEWRTGLGEAGLFADWDADASGTLAAGELGAGLFERFDDDDDGTLTVAEWDRGIDAWYGERTVDFEFDAWDENDDGALTESEFVTGFEEAGLYTTFATEVGVANAEAGIAEDEFLGGLFDWFDADEDTGLGEDEVGLFGGLFE